MDQQLLAGYNWVDYAVLGVIGLSTLVSLIRGFMREAISLATWAFACWVAIKFSGKLADLFIGHVQTPSIRLIISFVGLFIASLIVGGVVNYVLAQLVDRTGLSGTDRLLGMIFGVARGILLVGVMVLLGNFSPFSQDTWWKTSELIPHFQGLAQWLHDFLPEQFSQLAQYVPKSF